MDFAEAFGEPDALLERGRGQGGRYGHAAARFDDPYTVRLHAGPIDLPLRTAGSASVPTRTAGAVGPDLGEIFKKHTDRQESFTVSELSDSIANRPHRAEF
ncbi:hypothetical protein ACIQBJ_13250 [Kitasatospora sp. NPDC088391]|uniref:hypothetical protein n=1 Tax=Kitasatospora sp. NPDC088391 TaxID=3364074 RepID=UPI00380FF892